MVSVGKNIGYVSAGHQKFFNIPIHGYRRFFAAVFYGPFHGVLDVAAFERESVTCVLGQNTSVGSQNSNKNSAFAGFCGNVSGNGK